MSRRLIALLAGAGLVAAAALVWTSRHEEARGGGVDAAGDRRGLVLGMNVSATSGSLIVRTHVENRRSKPVRLEPDQCGRVTEVVLARTRFEPRGRTWRGSLRAVKKYILTDQRLRQDPDRFAPRQLGETSSEPPPCQRPERPVELDAGRSIDERWELPFSSTQTIRAVGSAHSVVRTEIVEARNPAQPQYLDIFMTGEAGAARRGRNLRLRDLKRHGMRSTLRDFGCCTGAGCWTVSRFWIRRFHACWATRSRGAPECSILMFYRTHIYISLT